MEVRLTHVRPLTWAVVGLFKVPDQQLQLQVDRGLWMGLFHDPVNTSVQLTPGGILATCPGAPPIVKRCLFSGPRLEVFSDYPADPPRIHAEVAGKLLRSDGIALGAMGFNFEYEFGIDGVDYSGRWLAERFVHPGIAQGAARSVTNVKVEFQATDPEDGVQRTVRFEPRAGRQDMLFLYINNHVVVGERNPLDPYDRQGIAKAMDASAQSTTGFVERLLTRGSTK
jgi:hypothetical protein